MIALIFALGAWAQQPAAEQGAETEASPAQPTEVTATLVVAVAHKRDAADALVAAAEEHGGWFQSRDSNSVSLRVPVDAVDALVEAAGGQGKVLSREITRVDAGQRIAELQGRLAGREEVLERYYDVLDEAGPKSIVAVEQQIVNAITVIEQLRGSLRVLQDRAENARVHVRFQFRDRQAPMRDGNSSFGWLNTLNLQDVLSGMEQHRARWRTAGVRVPAPPTGFSAWRAARRYRAAAPDNVMFRVRTVRHKPDADVAFWSEAVDERMRAAGYTVTAHDKADDTFLIELAAPMGTEDWMYLISVRPVGRRLVVAEAIGEVSDFAARRGAVVEAIDAITP